MSSDLRQNILDRLFEILVEIKDTTASGLDNVFRNIDEIPREARPCAVLIDGDENRSDRMSRTKFGLSPIVLQMFPVIAIGVNAKPDDIGPAANALRLIIVPKILGDATLATMLTPNGGIAYDGLAGRMSHGSLMAADSEFRFSIYYPFDPQRLL